MKRAKKRVKLTNVLNGKFNVILMIRSKFDYIKNTTLFLSFFYLSIFAYSQYTAIPDTYFEQQLIGQGIDSEGIVDGQVLTSDISSLTSLDVSNGFIQDLTGIEDFTALEVLDCGSNYLQSLDISSNTALIELRCGFNFHIPELNVSNNTNLKVLYCYQNNISELDISNNVLLESLACGNEPCYYPANSISVLDFSNNPELKYLSCSYLYSLTSIDVSHLYDLEYLYADNCNLPEIDLSNNILLTKLSLSNDPDLCNKNNKSNSIDNLDLSNNPNLVMLCIYNLNIHNLDIKNGGNPILTQVNTLENPNLLCIKVDDESAANNGDYPYSQWSTDEIVVFSEDCNLQIESIVSTKIKLFPNPVNDFLHLVTNDIDIRIIEIIDVLGKKVNTINKDFSTIDLSNLKKGVYFIKINTDNGVLTKKISKH